MTPRETVLEQIRHHETPTVPYTLSFEGDIAEQLDAHYGGAQWRDRLVQYITRVGAVETNITEPIDEGHFRGGFGEIWRSDRLPWHLEHPALPEPTLDGYDFPAPETFYRPEQKAEAFATCQTESDSFLLANLGWGLFERSWTLRGFENALIDAALNEDFYAEMLDRLVELYLAFVDYTVDLPVDAILFGDDWGDQRGVILGPERWRKLIKPRWARIYDAVHAHGKLVITHCCGSIAEIIPDLVEMGLDVLESVQPEAAGMNPYELKARWGDKLTFWGALGSQGTLGQGTPDDIRAEVARLCREMARGGGYILAPAKPLQPGMPIENAVAAVEAFADL